MQTFFKYFATILLFASITTANAQYGRAYETGQAVFYADYLHGRKTASGELYDKTLYTCAHKDYPFGTLLRVTRLDNRLSVKVRVNDRGPYGDGLIVDLAKTAAADIQLLQDGKTRVSIEVVGFSDNNPIPRANNNQVATYDIYTKYDPYNTRQTPKGYDLSTVTPKQQQNEPTKYGNVSKTTFATRGSNNNGSSPFNPAKVGADLNLKNKYTGRPVETPKSYDEVVLTPKSPNVKGIAIQLGAYADTQNANRQLANIKARGISDATIVRKSSGGKTLNKVVITGFSSRSQAQNRLNAIKNQYRIEGLVIQLN